ncbi:hypothetical protein ACQP2E_37010 [Actinoplanes sp. CA-015351]|uniref:hypothetical protein n=1 Tax=Actinoplanes sp. CA-015351 TaxID=3239897 RepID=UPI003D96AECB
MKSGRLRSRRARLLLALTAGVLGLLCLGGAGIFFVLYDDATEIDRTAPDTVTDSFLLAFLVNRDDQQVRLYTCDNPDLASITRLRDEMIQREQKFGVTVSASWGALVRTSIGAGQEDVGTQLTISSASGGKLNSSRSEEWIFRATETNGAWRVCGATKPL